MKVLTMSGISTYHLTLYQVEPILSFSQSSLHHIPSMNMGQYGLKQKKTSRAFQSPHHPNHKP